MIAQTPTTKEGWLNRAYQKIQRNPGIKIKDLARSLALSQSYTRELLSLLQQLQMVRIERERSTNALLLFSPDYKPTPPPRAVKAPACKVYRVPPNEVWRYCGNNPLPDSARINHEKAV